MQVPDVWLPGAREDPQHRTLRVVHISDTHLRHQSHHAKAVPPGDILIHSGDFGKQSIRLVLRHPKEANQQLEDFVVWMNGLPHKHKIFVAGNHEVLFKPFGWRKIQAMLGPNIIYLQDWGVEVEGLRVWGTPWNLTWGAFGLRESARARAFSHLPAGTDVLVSHMGGQGVLDLCARRKGVEGVCPVCGLKHLHGRHEGCPHLLRRMCQARVAVHLFGHAHDSFGHTFVPRKTGKPERYVVFEKEPQEEEEEEEQEEEEQKQQQKGEGKREEEEEEEEAKKGTRQPFGAEDDEGAILCVNSATKCHFFDVHVPSSRSPGQWTQQWQERGSKGTCNTS